MLITSTPEAASWALVAELLPRLGAAYRLIEGHPGGGQYDVLWLIDGSQETWPRHEVQLNRVGRVHVGRRDTSELLIAGGDDVWRRLAEGVLTVTDLADEVIALLGLDRRSRPGHPLAGVTQHIAEVISFAAGGGLQWEARWGVEDTSGYSDPTWRTRYFLPHLAQLPDVRVEDGCVVDGAEDHWFVLDERGWPVMAFSTDGQVLCSREPGDTARQVLRAGEEGSCLSTYRDLVFAAVQERLDVPDPASLLKQGAGTRSWMSRASDVDGDLHLVVGAADADMRGWALVSAGEGSASESVVEFSLDVAYGGGRRDQSVHWSLTGYGAPCPAWTAYSPSRRPLALRSPAGRHYPLG